MPLLALVLGFALPWWLGVALLQALPRRATASSAPGGFAWSLGCGWFAGIFVLTLWMRVLSAANIGFGIVAIALPLVAVAAAASWRVWQRGHGRLGAAMGAVWRGLRAADLPRWQRFVWFALLAWVSVRFALLLVDVVTRPLYPWDAWAHWATKARVWFELKSMVPFVPPAEWLQSAGLVYTDANPHYPATVPLMQVWGATLLGRWDDTLVNLPWWLSGAALALAVYGFLAQRGLPPLWALVGTWIVASLPILGVHIALAGYADLPLAAYLTLAVLAGWRWSETRGWDDLSLALLFAAACVLIKNPGKAWVLVMLPGALAAVLPRYGSRIALAGLGVGIVALVVLARLDVVLFGYRLDLDVLVPWRGLVDAYLMYANWHLLWYAAIAAALLGRRQLLAPELAPLTIVVAGGLLFLSLGFLFTNAGAWVEDQSTVNRATLHMAPLLALWSLLVLHGWSLRSPPDSASLAASAPDAR